MDRQSTLLQLGQKMSAATNASDWKALAAINTLMASSLPAMAQLGPWTPAERAALASLRDLHNQAILRTREASHELGKHLAEMQANKEGWLAYALNSEPAATGTTA
ncbi:MAG: hypothetical protein K2X55_10790 [Burkholderiaceae bacterium]|nr:hypothetical protein [Burkholderiaceae bacterium]